MSRKLGIFIASVGLGLLLGALAGLSVSPVVSIVIGAIAPFGVAFAGWIGTKRDSSIDPVEYYVAVAGLGWAAVAALLAGIHIRTHNSLSPTPLEIEQRWEAAGLSKPDAIAEARAELGSAAAGSGASSGKAAGATGSVLFSQPYAPSQLDAILPIVNGGDLNHISAAFNQLGGPLAQQVDSVDERIKSKNLSREDATHYLQGYYQALSTAAETTK